MGIRIALNRPRAAALRSALACLGCLVLFGCGGGGSGSVGTAPTGSSTTTPPASGGTVSSLAPMVDAFGTVLKEEDFGKGDAAAAGVSGTAAEGAALANAVVQIIDNAGHKVTGRTDANGVFRLRVDGFVPPLIASVTKEDGTVWYSPTLAAPVARTFINISISGLSDYIAAKVAESAGLGSSAQLTPAILLANPAALANAKKALAALLQKEIQDAGLDPLTFDPVLTVLVANGKAYDAVLDSVLVTNTPVTGTNIVPLKVISGSVSWSTASACVTTVTTVGTTPCSLTLGLRQEQLPVKYPASVFAFKTRLPSQANYSVSVLGESPDLGSRGGCALTNAQGVVGSTNVTNIGVFCK